MTSPPDALDEDERQLLAALVQDAQRTGVSLARELHLSETTVRRHIQRMEEAGIITGYGARVDYSRIGLPLQGLIQVGHVGAADLNAVKEIARRVPELVAATREVDRSALLLRVAARDPTHLMDVTHRLQRAPLTALKVLTVLNRPSESRWPGLLSPSR